MENKNDGKEKAALTNLEKKISIVCCMIAVVIVVLLTALIFLLKSKESDTKRTTATTEKTELTTTTAAEITSEISTTSATTTTSPITTTTSVMTTKESNVNISSYVGYWYTEEDGAENELHIHSTDKDGLVFTLSIYRIAGYDLITAELDGDKAYFNQNGIRGSMTFKKGYIIFDVDNADNPYVPTSLKNYTSHGKQEVQTTPQCGICSMNMFTDEEVKHGYCDYCYSVSYCHSCGKIKPNDVFEGQCSSCSGKYCDSCGADITYRGGTYDFSGKYLCDDCYYGTQEEEVLIGIMCYTCQKTFRVSSYDTVYICPTCGRDCTYD